MIAERQAALGLVAAALTLLLAAAGGRPRRGRRPARALPASVRIGAWIPAPRALVVLAESRVRPAALIAAGWEGTLPPAGLARAQAGLTTAAAALGGALTLAFPGALAVALALTLGGWLLPSRAVLVRGRTRAARIRAQLPDLLDLLSLCVASGMAVDPALSASAARLRGPLGAELAATLRDMALGATRRAAYEDLERRVPIPEMAQVVAALLQADELGAPLSRTLRAQADALREDRRRRARDQAARAAPAIQLVVALLMVPAALILIVAVMTLELARQVGPVFGGLG